MSSRHVRILLVEGDAVSASFIEANLGRFDRTSFEIVTKENGSQALAELEGNPNIDLVLMEYNLPDMNGLELTKAIKEKKFAVPIVFLTVNNDMALAVEVMKLGVDDYLFKEEISSNLLPQTLLGIVERRRLREEVAVLEVKKRRLEAMQQMVVDISGRITEPLAGMKSVVAELLEKHPTEKGMKYLEIIRSNIERLDLKLEKLQNLRDDKTVQYVKDIKMIDLS